MKTSAPTPLADRYIRCEDFATRIEGVELAPDVWAVFAQLAQSHTAAEIAQQLKLDVESVSAAIRRLVRRKLVRKHVLAWRDYAATAAPLPPPATTTTFEAPSAPASAPVASTTSAAAPYAPSRSVPPFYVTSAPSAPAPIARSPVISLRIVPTAASPRPAPAMSLRIEASRPLASSASPVTKTPADGLRLRPVLDAIGAKAGGGIAGQLLVYRVFLQIPTELMQAAGLHSLSLVDDHFTLRHPALRAALAETARRHAGVDIETLAAA
ncbi:MAG: hypothetical protein JF599_02325 [Verrucomicrobia bacterium]|nr:hypothetical protein [Verrucomicrobiota bacterium]